MRRHMHLILAYGACAICFAAWLLTSMEARRAEQEAKGWYETQLLVRQESTAYWKRKAQNGDFSFISGDTRLKSCETERDMWMKHSTDLWNMAHLLDSQTKRAIAIAEKWKGMAENR